MKKIYAKIRSARSFDNTPIRYCRSGSGIRHIVFVHGWMNDHNVWAYQYEKFLSLGFSVIALDLRGHGISGKPSSLDDYSLEAYARDVRAVIEKEEVDDYILVGHSLGGMVSLYYTYIFDVKDNPAFKGLVLLDTTYRNYISKELAQNLSGFVRNLFDNNNRLIARIRKKDNPFRISNILPRKTRPTIMHGLYYTSTPAVASIFQIMSDFDLEGYLKSIRFPVLIVEGKGDRIIPVGESIRMHNLIEGSELSIIESNYHRTIIKNADEVFKIMGKFLAKIGFRALAEPSQSQSF